MAVQMMENFWESKFSNEFHRLYNDAPRAISPDLVPIFPILLEKNRYRSVMPLPDETRVRLEFKDGEEGSDYINANFINGETPNSFHYYIACQAPIENTVTDFWRMIWEQQTGVILMLTGLVEGNSVKAHSYWPEEGKVKRYGDIVICHKKTFQVGEVTVRSILARQSTSSSNLFKENTHNAREIIQLQYEGWPDHGVPESTKTIQELLVLMTKFKNRASRQTLDGPVVVHCSAGLGRTGAFIGAHITLMKILHNETPNVKTTVELIRKQRSGLVRNEAQYAFIYTVVKDFLKSGSLKELGQSPISPPVSPQRSNDSQQQQNSSKTTETPKQ